MSVEASAHRQDLETSEAAAFFVIPSHMTLSRLFNRYDRLGMWRITPGKADVVENLSDHTTVGDGGGGFESFFRS